MPYAAAFIEEQGITPETNPQSHKVLLFCQAAKSRNEIKAHLGLKDNEHLRKSILNPLIQSGQLQLTIPRNRPAPSSGFIRLILKNKKQ